MLSIFVDHGSLVSVHVWEAEASRFVLGLLCKFDKVGKLGVDTGAESRVPSNPVFEHIRVSRNY